MSKKHALHVKKVTESLLEEWLCTWDNVSLSTTSKGIVLTWRLTSAPFTWTLLEERLSPLLYRYTSPALDFTVYVRDSHLYVGPFRSRLLLGEKSKWSKLL